MPFPAIPARVVALLFTILPLAGCGKSDGPRVPVFPVSGKVTVDGLPAEGAQVVLHPASNSTSHGVSSQGIVERDGAFQTTVYEAGDGAPAGDYVVTVQWFNVLTGSDGAGARGPNVIPREYSNPTTSPIKVTVSSSPNELAPIEIKTKAKIAAR